jgi:ammonia channel protein AmtB
MGFNATRRYRDKKTVDIAILLTAIAIIAGMIAWVLAAGGR